MKANSTTFIYNTCPRPAYLARARRAFACKLVLLIILLAAHTAGLAQDPQTSVPLDTNNPPLANEYTGAIALEALDFMASDIAALLHDDQFTLINVTLDAGSENEIMHQFPVFVTPSKKSLSMGTFYLVSDAVYNGAQIHVLMSLAEHMSRLGWHAVVMPAPQLMIVKQALERPKGDVQAQLSAEENNNQTAQTSTTESNVADPPLQAASVEAAQAATVNASDNSGLENVQTMVAAKYHQSEFDERYQATFNQYLTSFLLATVKATEQSGYQVFFAQGISAQALININSSEITPDAIVINNLYWPQRLINQSLAVRMAKHSAPILDLISTTDNQWALVTEDARKLSAALEIKAHYRQRQVDTLGFNQDLGADMTKEIYGWLNYLGW